MSTLHTINKSAFSQTTLSSCLQICSSNDAILLLEDGVFSAMHSAPCAKQLSALIYEGVKVYALSCDINARGLQDKINSDIYLTDYDGFVQLSIEHQRVQSWY